MTVSVVIPFRSACAQRARVLTWLRERWHATFPSWEVITAADGGEGSWSKGAAAASAVRESAGEVLVIVDADVWPTTISAAIATIEAGARWAIPHRHVARLTERATERVLVGDEDLELAAQRPRNVSPPRYSGMIGGGAVVIPRDAYLEAPLDPRFLGWGCEDHAWGIALLTLLGPPVRPKEGNLVHLWHPPARERGRGIAPESEALRLRYAAARNRQNVMRTLIAEAATGYD